MSSIQVEHDEVALYFADNAQKTCGQVAWLLGWRPAEFWESTPHEIAIILSVNDAQHVMPVDRAVLDDLMEKDRSHSEIKAP